MDRLTRRAGEIVQIDAKIVMSLETEEDILKDTIRSIVSRQYIGLAIQN